MLHHETTTNIFILKNAITCLNRKEVEFLGSHLSHTIYLLCDLRNLSFLSLHFVVLNGDNMLVPSLQNKIIHVKRRAQPNQSMHVIDVIIH